MARRRVPIAAPIALGLVMVTGCGHLGDNLTRRELVVRFDPAATPAQHRQVLAACRHFPNAIPEPLPSSTLRSARLNDVRYRIDHADDAELARLEACIGRFPFVDGVDDTGDAMH